MVERIMLVALSLSQGVDIILALVFLYLANLSRKRFLVYLAISWSLLGVSHLNAIFTVMTTGKVVHGGPVPVIVWSALLATAMAHAFTARRFPRGWIVAAALCFVVACHSLGHADYSHFQRSVIPMWFVAVAVTWTGITLWRFSVVRDWPLYVAAGGYVGAGLNTFTYPVFANTPFGTLGWSIHLVTTAACGLGMLLLHLAETRHALEREAFERGKAEGKALKAQRLESLVVLAGGVAHDFNNLLSAMLGHADLALMDLPEGSDARKDVERLRATGQKAFELTRALLAYVGKGEFRQERLRLVNVMRDVTAMLAPSFPEGLRVDCDFKEEDLEVEGDENQLGRVLMNLIRNAVEAMGEGEGRLLLSAGSVEVDEEALRSLRSNEGRVPGRWAFFRVSDEGTGLSEETLERMFDPFFTTKFTGRGLGLASSMGIVTRHGGMMGVRNREGGGAELCVYLPLADPTAASRSEFAGNPCPLSASDADLIAQVTEEWKPLQEPTP